MFQFVINPHLPLCNTHTHTAESVNFMGGLSKKAVQPESVKQLSKYYTAKICRTGSVDGSVVRATDS